MSKQYIICADGAKKASTKKAPELMYVEFDKDTFMVHFSENKTTSKDQMATLGDVFADACKGKNVVQVKQRSANVVGFSLQDTDDAAQADESLQKSYNAILAEAKRINAELKAKGGSGDGGSKGGDSSGGSKGSGDGGSKGGSKGGDPSGGSKGGSGDGGSKGGSKGGDPSGGSKGSGDGGSKDGGKGSGDDSKGFDKTKDIFGRPLKESYPGLFWPGMSKAEEEKACDEYWAMVRHVDKDIFHKK